MKNRDAARLECLRMAKGALLLKEKESAKDQELSDADAVKALRAEVRKRQNSIETYREVGKDEEVAKLEAEIAILADRGLCQHLQRQPSLRGRAVCLCGLGGLQHRR